ncbi:MAG: ATP-binding cassette domain-containing protein [Bacteroidetes bacterium]|nr:ATP-binding cassette domain-containing protein [Bacteroidota bacterium]
MGQNHLISFTHTTFRFYDKIAFPDTNLAISQGNHLAIVGNNGSGKTCLGKAIAGKVSTIKGESSFHISFMEIVFIDFQSTLKLSNNIDSPYLQQRWNSFDNSAAPLVKDYFWPGQKLDDYTQKLLKDFNAEHLLSRRNIHLSNGELKKIELIRALARKAKVLIIDNAFTGLDKASRDVLTGALKQIGSTCTLILLALPHDPIPEFIQGRVFCEDLKIVPQLSKETTTVHSIPKNLLLPGPVAHDELVKLNHIEIAYGEKQILKGINWSIQKGEHWALLGPNGSGKTTLLSLLAADNPQAYAREIYLFGQKRGTGETIWSIKRKLGFISPEQHQFTPSAKIIRKILIDDVIWIYEGKEARTLPIKDNNENSARQLAADKANQWLDWFGIGHIMLNREFGTLSSGEQRLVLFIRTLLYPFSLLIADEPCQGLDPNHIEAVRTIFHHLARYSEVASIFVTHQIQELPETTNLIFDMNRENRNNF